MTYFTALRQYTAKRIEEIDAADILVGIPCYNNEKTIAHVIQSLTNGLDKFYRNLRNVILIADGGSTDDTREAAKEYEIKPEVLDALFDYSWPGNVRELENAVERSIAMSGQSRFLKKENLIRSSTRHRKAFAVPKDLRPLKEMVQSMEKNYLKEVLKVTGGHKAQAAKILGISRKNLWEKMKEFDLE